MKVLDDVRTLDRLAMEQRGVFSRGDLEIALADPHPAALARRINTLLQVEALQRFTRGWYVAEGFDLPTLSQRLAPDSVVSFGSVLAKHLVIGPSSPRQVMATKVGRSRVYRSLGVTVTHLSVSPGLVFGSDVEQGVRYANAEKAMLDTLYFHLRGRKYSFDPFSDVNFSRLDRTRLSQYLARYQNPKFVKFAETLLGL